MKEKKSRISILRNGELPDRVPIILSLSSYTPKMLEISAEEFYLNPKTAFEANSWVQEMFPSDSEIGYTVPDSICMDFGGEVYFGKDSLECPKSVRIPARTEEELLKLKVPNPYTAPGISREFEYAKIRKKNGLSGAGMALSSPFRQSVEIIGMENLMRWMRKKPELVHHTCKMVVEYSIKKAEMYIKEFGTEGLSNAFSYPMESHHLISAQAFKEFSAPYALELHKRLMQMGVKQFSEHLCGNHKNNFWFWREELNLPKHTLASVGTELSLQEV
ncbi:MAG: uroporphyrinogen decarboxylase family protein, partial [Oscillospiraceae bacterium]